MRTIVILGGSSSIGKAICNQFNTQDNKLISTYFSNNVPTEDLTNFKSFSLDLNGGQNVR